MTIHIELARAEVRHRLGDLRARRHAREHQLRRRADRRRVRRRAAA